MLCIYVCKCGYKLAHSYCLQQVAGLSNTFHFCAGCLCEQAQETESKFRRLDEARARLEAEITELRATRSKLEGELRAVRAQWDTESREWAAERKRLSNQIAQLADSVNQAARNGGGRLPSSSVSAYGSSALALVHEGAELQRLRVERDRIIRNWSEETEILVAIWRDDKAKWDAERQTYRVQLKSLEGVVNSLQGSLQQTSSHYHQATGTAAREKATLEAALSTTNRQLQSLNRKLQDSERKSAPYRHQASQLDDPLHPVSVVQPDNSHTNAL